MLAVFRTITLAALFVISAACSKREGDSAPAPQPAPALADAARPPAAVTLDAAAPDPVSDVPKLDLAPVADATIEASSKLNTAGYKLHKKKDFAGAAAKYREALGVDAGNVLARYNLASAWVSAGEPDKALAVLAHFKRPDCRACTGMLLHARADQEWAPLHADPRFLAIVDGAVADAFDLPAQATAFEEAIRTGKVDGLEAFVHPRSPIQWVAGPPEDPDSEGVVTRLHGWPAFQAWATKPKDYEKPKKLTCKKSCCETSFGGLGDSSRYIEELCFEGRGGVLFLSKVLTHEGFI